MDYIEGWIAWMNSTVMMSIFNNNLYQSQDSRYGMSQIAKWNKIKRRLINHYVSSFLLQYSEKYVDCVDH